VSGGTLSLHSLGNAEIAKLDIEGLDIGGLDNDGRMCGQLTELKLKKIHSLIRFSLRVFEAYALLVLRCY